MEYDSELCLNPRQGFGSTPKLRECPLPLISFAWHFYSIVNIVSEFLARFVVHLLNLEMILLLQRRHGKNVETSSWAKRAFPHDTEATVVDNLVT